MQLLREVVLQPDLADRLELRLDPVDVLLLADEDVREKFPGPVVALRHGQLDATIEALDRLGLEREIGLELLGNRLPDPQRK